MAERPGTGADTTTGAAAADPAAARAADAARQRLAVAQAALLSALVAGGPVPEGFDRRRLRVQRQALAAKHVAVLAKVAPELPALLGERYRPAALRHARRRPMTGGYRESARAFARQLLTDPAASLTARERRAIRRWLRAGDGGGAEQETGGRGPLGGPRKRKETRGC